QIPQLATELFVIPGAIADGEYPHRDTDRPFRNSDRMRINIDGAAAGTAVWIKHLDEQAGAVKGPIEARTTAEANEKKKRATESAVRIGVAAVADRQRAVNVYDQVEGAWPGLAQSARQGAIEGDVEVSVAATNKSNENVAVQNADDEAREQRNKDQGAKRAGD